jgi:hypothetical protein
MAMELIETVELASSASSIEFTSIPQDGVDLLLLVSARTDGNNSNASEIAFNGDSTNRSQRVLTGAFSTASSSSSSSITGSQVNQLATVANTFSSSSIYIANYAESTAKSVSVDTVDEDNATGGFQFQRIIAGSWNDTDAITSIEFSLFTDSFVAGTTASLYKIS